MADDWVDVPTSAPPPASPYQPTLDVKMMPSNAPVDRDSVVSFWENQAGVADHVAEGIADALHGESGLKPLAVNPASGATGLAQDLGSRKQELQAQPNWQDPQVQLQNLLREVQGGDKIAAQHWNEIKNAPDRKTAAQLWEKYVERPGPSGGDWQTVSAPGWNVSPNALNYEMTRSDTDVRYMSPSDYLAMTPEQASGETASAKRASLMKSLGHGDDIEAIPTLDVKLQGSKLVVYDQDGRNRAIAAQEAGIDLIPVAIHGVPSGSEPKKIQGMRGGEARDYDFKPVPPPLMKPQAPRSVLSGIGEGIIDPLLGIGQLAQHVAPAGIEGSVNRMTGYALPDMDKVIAQREAEIAASRGPDAGFDWARAGGNVLTAAGMAALAPEVFGGSTLGRLALSGAAQGATAPVTDTSGGFAGPKAEQMTMGALASPVTGMAGRALGQAIGPTFRPAAAQLLGRGVRLTPGQMMGPRIGMEESKAASLPLLGSMMASGRRRAIMDFNRAAYNQTLEPIGLTVSPKIPVGTEGIKQLGQALSNAYDALMPHIHFRGDPQWAADLADIQRSALTMPPDQQAQLRAVFDNHVRTRLGPGGTMDGRTFKNVESELTDFANRYMKSDRPAEEDLGRSVNDLLGAMRENLERHSPAVADELKALNTSWAAFSRLQIAAANRVKSLGVFTPADLLSAEKRAAGRRVFSRGDGLLQGLASAAEEVIGSTYPDSGTAGRLGLMGLLTGAAHFEPHLAAAGIGLSAPYTGAGMTALRSWATAFPQVRRMLGQVPRLTAQQLAPGAALVAGRTAMPALGQ